MTSGRLRNVGMARACEDKAPGRGCPDLGTFRRAASTEPGARSASILQTEQRPKHLRLLIAIDFPGEMHVKRRS
jgi:hypothetical protein